MARIRIPDEQSSQYRQELVSMVEMFEYQTCEVCGEDVQVHVFGPDAIGNPHAYCMTGDEPARVGIIIPFLSKGEN